MLLALYFGCRASILPFSPKRVREEHNLPSSTNSPLLLLSVDSSSFPNPVVAPPSCSLRLRFCSTSAIVLCSNVFFVSISFITVACRAFLGMREKDGFSTMGGTSSSRRWRRRSLSAWVGWDKISSRDKEKSYLAGHKWEREAYGGEELCDEIFAEFVEVALFDERLGESCWTDDHLVLFVIFHILIDPNEQREESISSYFVRVWSKRESEGQFEGRLTLYHQQRPFSTTLSDSDSSNLLAARA